MLIWGKILRLLLTFGGVLLKAINVLSMVRSGKYKMEYLRRFGLIYGWEKTVYKWL